MDSENYDQYSIMYQWIDNFYEFTDQLHLRMNMNAQKQTIVTIIRK